MFMVLSSWPWSLREFTRFIWGMQTERRGCHASLKASAPQLSTTPLSRGPPLSTGSVVGDRVLAGISVCPMGEESEDGRRKTSTQPELKRGIGATDNKHSSVNHGTTQPTNDWNGQSSWNPQGIESPICDWRRGGFWHHCLEYGEWSDGLKHSREVQRWWQGQLC